MEEDTSDHRVQAYKNGLNEACELIKRHANRIMVSDDQVKSLTEKLKQAEEREKGLREALEKVKVRQEEIKDNNISQKSVTWHIADKALKTPATERR